MFSEHHLALTQMKRGSRRVDVSAVYLDNVRMYETAVFVDEETAARQTQRSRHRQGALEIHLQTCLDVAEHGLPRKRP